MAGNHTPVSLSPLQQSLAVIRHLETRLAAAEQASSAPIAVVSMACRFPGGADTPEKFRTLLRDGVDAVGEIPPGRWDMDALFDPDPGAAGRIYARQGAYLQGVDLFDAGFFGISAREANALDPQQRMLLEVSWELLERAGHVRGERAARRAGVFVGIGQNDYARLRLYGGDLARIGPYDGTGNGFSFAAGRISYALGLRGPNLAVDTACSSSLVAVHLACRSLRAGECDMALAGGVQLILAPDLTAFLCRTRALARDGRSKAFDASADGYGRGEGCGMVLLKRMSDAVAAGDHIHAVIRGTAMNHGGAASGLTVPNGLAQAELVRAALQHAGVAASEVGYIEAHGTGTPLGDPIELEALASIFGADDNGREPVLVGSVKTNIGHLEAAAGIAGLMKAALALEYAEIPASLHFGTPNPRVAWAELPLRVPAVRTPWPSGYARRVAGVSSFGMSGANAHVVLEEPPADLAEAAPEPDGFAVLTISGRTPEALRELAIRYRSQLETLDRCRIGDYCWSANTGRTAFEHRLAFVAQGRDGLVRALRSFEQNGAADGAFLQGTVRSGERLEPALELTAEEKSPHQMASLWVRGAAIDWHSFYGAQRRRRIALPSYPFERQRYWLEGRSEPPAQPFIERHFASPLLRERLLETHIGKSRFPYLHDHRIFGRIVVPAAWHVSLLLSAAQLLFPREAMAFEDLVFGQALALEDDEERLVQLVATPASSGELGFRIISFRESAAADTPHLVHASGKMRQALGGAASNRTAPPQFARSPIEVDTEAFFRAIARLRIDLGPAFRWLDAPFTDYSTAQARIQTPLGLALAPYELHPALVDTCFQLLLSTLPEEEFRTFVPLAIESLTYHPGRSLTNLRAEAQRTSLPDDPSERLSGGIRLLNGDGELVLEVRGFMGRAATAARLLRESRVTVLSEIVWQPIEKAAEKFSLDQPWLILSDGAGIAAAAARAIRTQGGQAIECRAGDSLPSLPARLAGVMHFGGLDALQEGSAGWGSLLRLVQNVWDEAGTACRDLCIFTCGAQPIGESACAVQQAPILGMARVIASEMPQVRCARVDLDPARPEASALSVIAGGIPSDEDEIAEREGRIYAPRIQPLAAAPAANTPLIAADRTYLISGGWGGLGLHIGAWLVDRGVRHLILLGRRKPAPAPSEIHTWEARGVSVRLIEADVCDAARMRKLFREDLAELPPLAGVVHAAGLVDDGPLLAQSPERFSAVLAPKQIGAWLLHEETSRLPLDFFVCFSSAAALLGSPGQGSYAAANAFLDALAHYRRACGLPAVSINWGPWSGSGMAARAAQRNHARWSSQGLGTLSPEEGVALFGAALASGRTQVVALPIDWKTYLDTRHSARPGSLFAALAPGRRRPAAAATNGKSKDMREIVQHAVSQVLDARAAEEPQRSLFELGLDSISAIELRTALQEALARPLRSTLVFDHPTIEALVQALTPPAVRQDVPREAPPAAANGSGRLGRFAAMSEQELEAVLLRKIDFHERKERRP